MHDNRAIIGARPPGRGAGQRHRALACAAVLAAGLAALAAPLRLAAQVFESIDVGVEQGVARVRIEFATRVQYLRHAPRDHGTLLNLYLTAPGGLDPALQVGREVLTAPPTPGLPAVTVSFDRAQACDPRGGTLCVAVRFDAPVSWSVRAGDDQRSIELYIPLAAPQGAGPESPAADQTQPAR